MDRPDVCRVVIRHNLVLRIDRAQGAEPAVSNLEAGTQLAMNHQQNGCIDGDYFFSSMHNTNLQKQSLMGPIA